MLNVFNCLLFYKNTNSPAKSLELSWVRSIEVIYFPPGVMQAVARILNVF
jgi:hypothetical protein